MKGINGLLLAFALFFFGTLTYGQYMSQSEKQDFYIGLLEGQGIKGSIDSDGDVQFIYNEHEYFIGTSSDDQQFVNIVLFNLWEIESDEERRSALFACSTVSEKIKVVKAYIVDNNVWFAYEFLIPNLKDLDAKYFKKIIGLIEDASATFVDEM